MKWLVIWLLLVPGIPFIAISLAIVLYANWPNSELDWTLSTQVQNADQLVLITHGKGDNVDTWAQPLASALRRKNGGLITTVDWQGDSHDLFRCSVNARRIGHRLADTLLQQNPQLNRVQFIAHSAGSFMAYGFCQQAKKVKPGIQIKTTYLDPTSVYGGWDWNFGVRRFGDCADESEAFYNVGDGVPGSEVPLKHAKNWDVSAARPASWQNGHLWPTQYYLQQALMRPPTTPME